MSDGASGGAPSDMSMGGGFTTLIQIFVSISSALVLQCFFVDQVASDKMLFVLSF
jgi:hypothetical protein